MLLPRDGPCNCIASLVLLICVSIVAGHGDKDERANGSFSEQAQDFEHIKMHLKENLGLDDAAADKYMKEVEGEIHFFLMNDLNRDSRIDGLEIYKIIAHQHQEHEMHSRDHKAPPMEENKIVEQIDEALRLQDTNGDGYIDYNEFLRHYRPDLHDKATGGRSSN